MKEIITDKPANSKIFNDLIKILDSLTGIKWGYVKNLHSVKYITSSAHPIKIGIKWGKPYEKNIKYKLDISINNKSPQMFNDYNLWTEAVTAELQIKLLNIIKDVSICRKIREWSSDGEYALIIKCADEQNKLHNINENKIKLYDHWLDECLRI